MEDGSDVWIIVFSIVSFFLFRLWFLEIDQQQWNRQATAWGKKQTVLDCISKLSYITCRWDSSTSQPGRKLLLKQREKGGTAFDREISWNLGRQGKGRIAQWWKMRLCCWKGWCLVSESTRAIVDNLKNWVCALPEQVKLYADLPVPWSHVTPAHLYMASWWVQGTSPPLVLRARQLICFGQWAVRGCYVSIGLKYTHEIGLALLYSCFFAVEKHPSCKCWSREGKRHAEEL